MYASTYLLFECFLKNISQYPIPKYKIKQYLFNVFLKIVFN